ncbi:Mdj1p [Lachancea thermotolerans CBS 6340]|uniref:DnaJ homolog 1, mitochondrial n=1 Tax=Lachancea thermotolerans (strain ATCC 56472 / CBS 6340 / NRRL Y-8284) TaxID=559295 RepID=C5DBI4_LACTC|nr:KLTH0A02882p [Lachancea thermotolerans CBS 6340]CAR21141.1 KLTH0A02882p [Lachancea thermotolerans CBS 6340]
MYRRTLLRLSNPRALAPRLATGPSARLFHASTRLLDELKDPYATLGVSKSASGSEIKKAYYKLAKKYHPDINKAEDAQKKFHDLQNAYEILSDDSKRQQWDQFGPAAFSQGGAGAPGGGAGGAGAEGFGGFGGFGGAGFGGINFEDLFGAAFGGGAGAGGAGARSRGSMFREYQGSPIELTHRISFKDSVFGTKNVNLKFSAYDPCGTCDGSGLKPGASRTTCPGCSGTGTRVHIRAGFQMASTCNQCGGEGSVVRDSDTCATCHGEGASLNKDHAIKVDLPHGLQDGDVIRISGQGSYPNIAVDPAMKDTVRLSRGDVLLRIRVDKDPRFQIKNKYDIWLTQDIPITTAALGGIVTVPTVDGEQVRLKVAPGTQHNDVVSISQKGVPRGAFGSRGDMKVQYKISIKKPQSQAERCLWEALADVTGDTLARRSVLSSQPQQSSHTDNPDAPGALGKLENFISNTFKKIKGDKK